MKKLWIKAARKMRSYSSSYELN